MSYIHCSRGCEFSQDDFWTLRFKPQWKFWKVRSIFGYNPITIFLEHLEWLWKPRWIDFDSHFVQSIESEYGYRIKSRVVRVEPNPNAGISVRVRTEIFSWSMLGWEFTRMIRKFKNQKWWTEKSYKKDSKQLCPKCGEKIPNSCID
jgi:hypothetical protein